MFYLYTSPIPPKKEGRWIIVIKAQETTSTALNVGFFKSCPLCLPSLQLYCKVRAEEMRVIDSKPHSKFLLAAKAKRRTWQCIPLSFLVQTYMPVKCLTERTRVICRGFLLRGVRKNAFNRIEWQKQRFHTFPFLIRPLIKSRDSVLTEVASRLCWMEWRGDGGTGV